MWIVEDERMLGRGGGLILLERVLLIDGHFVLSVISCSLLGELDVMDVLFVAALCLWCVCCDAMIFVYLSIPVLCSTFIGTDSTQCKIRAAPNISRSMICLIRFVVVG